MNVYDYFFRESGFLHKKFLLGNKEEITYDQLQQESLRQARYIKETYGQNQNIILASPNSSFFLVAYLAILKSGNVCIPLNPATEENNFTYIVDICKSNIAFISSSIKDPKWEILDHVYYELPDTSGRNSVLSRDPFEDDAFDQERLAEIIFTSGSTGEPKGVMISHGNIIANTNSIIEYLGLTGDDIVQVVLPFYYCYGLSLLHTHLKVGGSVVFNNNFMFLGTVINDLKKFECTGFAGVPSHFQILLRKSKSFKTMDFPHLRYVTQAGGKLHSVFIKEFADAQPDIPFFVMYGQTEATARLSYLPPHMLEEKLGSLGKAISGVELQIINDTGEIIEEADVIGELVAKGGNIMKGYLGDEEDTALTLREGWLHTGDLAYKDSDGYFYHTARVKEIIKVGGMRISPKEIEELIVTLPGVVDCSVIGIPDDILGEALKAEIVVSDINDHSLDESFIKKFCTEKLRPEKVPHVVQFSSKLDIAPTGKKIKNK